MQTDTYVWDTISDNLLGTTDGVAATTFTSEPYQFGGLISHESSTGESRGYHFDARGDTRQLTSNLGIVTSSYAYDAWGNIIQGTVPAESSFLFAGMFGYLQRESDDKTYVRARWYSSSQGSWISLDPIFHETHEAYCYGGNSPINRIDPSGMDWLDSAANYVAGIGDTLSFGATNALRNKMGINGGIDHDSTAYISGVATEIVAETVITCGGAVLRRAAGRVVARQAFGQGARRQARSLIPSVTTRFTRVTRTGTGPVHHVNTLFGHPAIRNVVYNRFGMNIRVRLPRWLSSGLVTQSRFPSAGLPAFLYNNRWNLVRVNAQYHRFIHLSARMAENVVYYQTHALSIFAKLGLSVNRIACEDCSPEHAADEDVEIEFNVEAGYTTETSEFSRGGGRPR